MDAIEQNVMENLQLQLEELECLQATFYNPGEIKIEDCEVLREISDYVAAKSTRIPPCLDYTINLIINDLKFEMCVSLAHEYPSVEPEIYLRNHRLNKSQHVELNRRIGEFIAEQPKGQPYVYTAVSWLQENAPKEVQSEPLLAQKSPEDEELSRYWIYSHHIYSKTKRRALIDLADKLKLTGFVMPGKPGIICVEGATSDVVDWWQTVKSMNWKKIFCKITETDKNETGNFLKFQNFVEKVFENHGPKFNHMDMREFYNYLDEHELGYIFKDIFGVEVKGG